MSDKFWNTNQGCLCSDSYLQQIKTKDIVQLIACIRTTCVHEPGEKEELENLPLENNSKKYLTKFINLQIHESS